MSETDRPSDNEAGEAASRTNHTPDPNAPALKDNAEADFGEKGEDLPDAQAGLNESEKLEDAVAGLDDERS